MSYTTIMPKPTMPIKIAIAGAGGRMGAELIKAVAADPAFTLTLAFEQAGHASIDTTAADGKTLIQAEPMLGEVATDVLIDFTAPVATLQFAQICRAQKTAMVIGSTGFDEQQLQQLKQVGEDIPILFAQNMSIGVNALYRIAAYAAQILKAGRLGGGYDIEISEEHHRHKKDAPSGTALRLGQEVAQASGSNFDEDAVFARHGADALRGEHDIGFSVVRGGDIVGTHRVQFSGSGEQIEITHRSASRANYVAGALRAAKFVAHATPQFYNGIDAILASEA